MRYFSKKQLLISIQKSRTLNLLFPCYRTCNLGNTRYIQHTLFFLFLHSFFKILFHTAQIVFYLIVDFEVCQWFLNSFLNLQFATVINRLTFQDAIFVNVISLTFDRDFKPDLNKSSLGTSLVIMMVKNKLLK